MDWNIVRLADAAVSPWKNGGGTTRELAAWPATGDWMWRLSVADIARDGPFSSYPGVHRWFAVLEGEGVELRQSACHPGLDPGSMLPETDHRLTRFSPPHAFDGAQAPDCRLVAGPTRDFNLMLRSPPAAGEMLRIAGNLEIDLFAMEFIAIYSSGKRCSGTFGSEKLRVEPNSLAWRQCDAPTALRIEADDALCMRIRA